MKTDEDFTELDDTQFAYGVGAEAHFSCSVTYQNRMLVFGGARTSHMFSEVLGCGLDVIGRAPVNLFDVACGDYTIAGQNVVMLCFPVVIRASWTRFCWSFNGTDFILEQQARYDHESVSLGNLNGKPVAVSGFGGGTQVEILNESWESAAPLPFQTTGIFYFSTLSINNIMYLFGKTVF